MPPADVQVPDKVLLVVRREDVRAAFWEKYASTEDGDEKRIEGRLRARWARGTKSLLKWNVIGSKEPWLWFTGKEVQRFRVRGVAQAEAAPSYIEPEQPGEPALEHDFS
jgi:hypothetical protein